MRVDVDVYGSAPMADPGAGGPDPRDRRVTNDQVKNAFDQTKSQIEQCIRSQQTSTPNRG